MQKEEMWLLTEKYKGEKTERFFADCARLQEGEPLAYVIGHIPFLNTTIYLDSHPLIPRPETEFWVSELITRIDRGLASVKVLDLCAGSGCIGVAVLNAISTAQVDFAEIDVRHHPTIQKNIEANCTDYSRARIFSGDLFENISDTYDVILTNPPYIDPLLKRTDPSVLQHEPHQALFGGSGGFELIEHIIDQAPLFLKDFGTLVIEHEPEQSEILAQKAAQVGFTAHTYPDQFGILRYTELTRRSGENMSR